MDVDIEPDASVEAMVELDRAAEAKAAAPVSQPRRRRIDEDDPTYGMCTVIGPAGRVISQPVRELQGAKPMDVDSKSGADTRTVPEAAATSSNQPEGSGGVALQLPHCPPDQIWWKRWPDETPHSGRNRYSDEREDRKEPT